MKKYYDIVVCKCGEMIGNSIMVCMYFNRLDQLPIIIVKYKITATVDIASAPFTFDDSKFAIFR